VTNHQWLGSVLLVAACGGGSAPQTQPANSASGAVRSFMEAVADSNLNKMANLWGTASGPAAKTNQPPDWQRRIGIMRAYLRNDSFRITSDVPEADENRRALLVEIKRSSCTWSVPFTAIKTRDGSWIVTQLDLAAAGNPARPCQEGAPKDSAPQG
jgi:hypothetical protein